MPQRPYQGRKIVVEDFKGVNQAYDTTLLPLSLVPWSYGVIDNEGGHLQRLGGKMPLEDTSRPKESIISMAQLHFTHSSMIVIHSTSNRELVDGIDVLSDSGASDGIDEFAV